METRNDSEYASLASKLDELAQVCARLSRENAELRERMSRLTSVEGPSLPSSSAVPAGPREQRAVGNDRLSRRRLGKALAASAVGVVGAAALADATAGPAAASNGNAVTAGNATTAESATTVNFDGSSAPGVVFLANNSTFEATDALFPAALGGWTSGGSVPSGVYAFTGDGAGYGVIARNVATSGAGVAVSGLSSSAGSEAFAVMGTIMSTNPGGFSAGVRGINSGTGGLGIGVWGSHAGSGWGVYGTSVSGIGVIASGGSGVGVSASGAVGVVASGSSLSGTGVTATGGTGVSASGSTTGVSATGPTAVHATGTHTGVSASGVTGVHGSGSGTAGVGVKGGGSGSGGRGGIFSGQAAQVKLNPGSLGTHPTSGQRGDLYADNKGRLWFCKAGGNTAVWHQIALPARAPATTGVFHDLGSKGPHIGHQRPKIMLAVLS